MESSNTGVLIVGAGPSGLVAACFLAREGIPIRIIEKRIKIKETTGALVIHPASMEVFAQLNISSKILETATIVDSISIKWNSSRKINIGLSNMQNSLSLFPHMLLLEQYKLEMILEEYLKEMNIQVERGIELISLETGKNDISTWLVDNRNQLSVHKFKYLIGADGKDSKTREMLKISYRANKLQKPIFIMDFEGSCNTKSNNVSFIFSKKNSIGVFHLKDSIIRLDGTLPDTIAKKEKITVDDIKPLLPSTVEINSIRWFSVFRVHHLIATTFMKRNCFLIGDAAHTHNPVGGQGMNSGIQDASNLSWKLAYVIKGKYSHNLLNSYTRERKPKVQVIMKASRFLYDFITFRSYFHKLIWLGTGHLNTLILKKLLTNKQFNIYINKSISQFWLNYDSELVIQAKKVKGPKPGERFRYDYIPVNVASDLSYKLIVFTCEPTLMTLSIPETLPLSFMLIQKTAKNAEIFEALDIKFARTYLIRPDNFIAMAVEGIKVEFVMDYLNAFINEPVSF